MKIEPKTGADKKQPEFVPAGDEQAPTFEQLKERLEACVVNQQVSNTGARAAFDDFSKSNNISGLISFIVNLEAKPKVAPRDVVEQAFGKDEENLEPVTNEETLPRQVVRKSNEISKEEETDWSLAKGEYDGAVIEPSPMAEVVATEIFEKLDLPSQGVFYDSPAIKARKLGFHHMSKLHALLTIKNPLLLIEALSTTVNHDLQKFTQGDFTYLLYWLRSKSLPKSPIRANWISRYGSTETMIVNISKLKEIRIALTPEKRKELERFKSLGFDFPRVYDILSISRFDVADNPNIDQWAYEQSQYFKPLPGETIGGRLERISQMMEDGIELLEELAVFKREFAHGVSETIDVQVDLKKFDPRDAIRNLTGAADRNEAYMYSYGFDPSLFEMIQDYRKEALEIEEHLEKGESVIPRVETIDVNIDALSFFQALLN